MHHQTVPRCIERAVAYGTLAALDDRRRPGKEPVIMPDEEAWLVSLACDKVRQNMARLRTLRLAKEAEATQTEIAAANQPAKARSKRRFKQI